MDGYPTGSGGRGHGLSTGGQGGGCVQFDVGRRRGGVGGVGEEPGVRVHAGATGSGCEIGRRGAGGRRVRQEEGVALIPKLCPVRIRFQLRRHLQQKTTQISQYSHLNIGSRRHTPPHSSCPQWNASVSSRSPHCSQHLSSSQLAACFSIEHL